MKTPLNRDAGATTRRVKLMELALLRGNHRPRRHLRQAREHQRCRHLPVLLTRRLPDLFPRSYASTEEVKAQPASVASCSRSLRQHPASSSCSRVRQIPCGCATLLAAKGNPRRMPTGTRQRDKCLTTSCASRVRSTESSATHKARPTSSRTWRTCLQTPSEWRCSSAATFRRLIRG